MSYKSINQFISQTKNTQTMEAKCPYKQQACQKRTMHRAREGSEIDCLLKQWNTRMKVESTPGPIQSKHRKE